MTILDDQTERKGGRREEEPIEIKTRLSTAIWIKY